MKKIYKLFLSAMYLSLAGCLSHPKYLESKYFWQRKVDIIEEGTNVCISISGLCGHSSLGVDRPEKMIRKDVLVIEFPLRLGASGTIREMVHVPIYINKVKLAGDLIWERKH